MQELDLEVAGEFLLMAATLMQIKVRMLLPKTEEEEEGLEEDPREELMRRLLEYKRFKEVAESLEVIEERERRKFPRSHTEWIKEYRVTEETSNEELLKDVSLFDLVTAFKQVLDSMPRITAHDVTLPDVSVEDQVEFLMNKLEEHDKISFYEMIGELKERLTIIVTFMAMLELVRKSMIRFQQASLYGDIWIMKRRASIE